MWSDDPAVEHAVVLWFCQGLGENPYKVPGMEEPPPMTRAELIKAIRAEFGEDAARSLRMPVAW